MVAAVSWSPKDPDETGNYELDWSPLGLADGDTIVSSAWVDITGVTKESDNVSASATSTFVTLSGGTAGSVGLLTNRIMTVAGETLEQPVILPIVASGVPAVLSGYDKPTPGHLVARYPAFAGVPYLTVQQYLTDAESGVDASWVQPDYAPALMALAAHQMALFGIGSHGEAAAYAAAGVTRIRSGNFDANFSEAAVNRANAGTLDATPYGRLYKTMLRRNRRGPRIVSGRPLTSADLYPLIPGDLYPL